MASWPRMDRRRSRHPSLLKPAWGIYSREVHWLFNAFGKGMANPLCVAIGTVFTRPWAPAKYAQYALSTPVGPVTAGAVGWCPPGFVVTPTEVSGLTRQAPTPGIGKSLEQEAFRPSVRLGVQDTRSRIWRLESAQGERLLVVRLCPSGHNKRRVCVAPPRRQLSSRLPKCRKVAQRISPWW